MTPLLRLRWRPFAFTLPQPMVTAHGAWSQRRGWLLRLEAPDGRLGWGEAGIVAAEGVTATGLAGAGSPGADRSQGRASGDGRTAADRIGADRTGAGSTGAGKTGGVTSRGDTSRADRASFGTSGGVTSGAGGAGAGTSGGDNSGAGRAGAPRDDVLSEAAMAGAAASASAWGGVAASAQPQASAFPDHPGPWADGCAALAPHATRAELESCLPRLPAPLAFALGSALAELDGLVGAEPDPWRPAPPSAWLLPAGEAALEALRSLLVSPDPADAAWPTDPQAPTGAEPWPFGPPASPGSERWPGDPAASTAPASFNATALTVKWKVAAHPDPLERRVLEELLALLPPTARLRLDANGGWDRSTATAWADRLADEPRLEWLEQPLSPADQEGLEALAQRLPVALDESLRIDPTLRQRWPGWQVRRPALEGDPRPLLAELRSDRPRLMLSTALETGIGRRWVHHLAALQADGPSPTAPGLAPGWTPQGPLFAADPAVVWEAAA